MREVQNRQVWRVAFTLPARHADNDKSYSRSMQQLVAAPTVERAIALVRERYGDVPLWSVNHMSSTEGTILLDDEGTP